MNWRFPFAKKNLNTSKNKPSFIKSKTNEFLLIKNGLVFPMKKRSKFLCFETWVSIFSAKAYADSKKLKNQNQTRTRMVTFIDFVFTTPLHSSPDQTRPDNLSVNVKTLVWMIHWEKQLKRIVGTYVYCIRKPALKVPSDWSFLNFIILWRGRSCKLFLLFFKYSIFFLIIQSWSSN